MSPGLQSRDGPECWGRDGGELQVGIPMATPRTALPLELVRLWLAPASPSLGLRVYSRTNQSDMMIVVD